MEEFELKSWYLRNHELFNTRTESEIKQLLSIAHFTSGRTGSLIYSHTKGIDKIYLLLKGRIKIACNVEKDRQVLLEILKEGDIFGELTLIRSGNREGEFAEVLSAKAIICSFPLAEFKQVLAQSPDINIAFSQMLAEKIKVVSKKYCDIILNDAKRRVLNFFILHAKHEGKWTGNRAEINMYCTHEDIANFTAAKRQTVTTIINTLVKENRIIYKGRSKVIIPDVKNLEM